jgi:aryl-alcohol dehydrogenase-like predicted oxidoreductase
VRPLTSAQNCGHERGPSTLWAYRMMVSPFTLGTMEFGNKVDQTEAARLFSRTVDAGVTVVANVYAEGRSET